MSTEYLDNNKVIQDFHTNNILRQDICNRNHTLGIA